MAPTKRKASAESKANADKSRRVAGPYTKEEYDAYYASRSLDQGLSQAPGSLRPRENPTTLSEVLNNSMTAFNDPSHTQGLPGPVSLSATNTSSDAPHQVLDPELATMRLLKNAVNRQPDPQTKMPPTPTFARIPFRQINQSITPGTLADSPAPSPSQFNFPADLSGFSTFGQAAARRTDETSPHTLHHGDQERSIELTGHFGALSGVSKEEIDEKLARLEALLPENSRDPVKTSPRLTSQPPQQPQLGDEAAKVANLVPETLETPVHESQKVVETPQPLGILVPQEVPPPVPQQPPAQNSNQVVCKDCQGIFTAATLKRHHRCVHQSQVSTRGVVLTFRAADGFFHCSMQDCEKTTVDGNAMNSHFHPKRRHGYGGVELGIADWNAHTHDLFWVLFQTMDAAMIGRLKEFITTTKTNQGIHRFRIERMPEEYDVDNIVFVFWAYNAASAWPVPNDHRLELRRATFLKASQNAQQGDGH